MKKCFSILVLVFCWVGFTPLVLPAQGFSDTAAQLNKILDSYGTAEPGAQVLVARGNKVLFETARGMAHLEHGIPWTTTTISEAGSVSKQFTAAAVLLLEQRGKLALTDPVAKYFPELPAYAQAIQIQHLIHHTSGLKDWGSITELAGWPRGTIALNNQDVLQIIARQPGLNHAPGEEYIYSNSNYNLLALLVERVSGQNFAAFTAKELLQPAGMTQTSWRDDPNRVVPNRATAYSKTGSQYVTNMPNEYAHGNGGLLTTCQDLFKWTRHYLVNGQPNGKTHPLDRQALNKGQYQSYAMGLFVDSVQGHLRISHSGATAGYRANLEYYPGLDLTIVWLSNNASGNFNATPTALREVFLGKPSTGPLVQATAAPERPIKIWTLAQLKEMTGTYHSVATAATAELRLEKNTLTLYLRPGKPIPFGPAGGMFFSYPGMEMEWSFEKGKPKGFWLSISRARKVWFEKPKKQG